MNSLDNHSEPHRIRLQGPWDATVVACQSDAELVGQRKRLSIPSSGSSWFGINFRGTVSFVRRFGCPTNLGERQEVWLIVAEVDSEGSVSLNDHPLGRLRSGAAPFRIEIGKQLLSRNVLTIEVPVASEDRPDLLNHLVNELLASVRLEIVDL